jgi:hypothetical protein
MIYIIIYCKNVTIRKRDVYEHPDKLYQLSLPSQFEYIFASSISNNLHI